MLNGGIEKVGMVLVAAYVAFNEWRHKNSVSAKRFQDFQRISFIQMNRLESHLWDIAKSQNISLNKEVPENIKNGEF